MKVQIGHGSRTALLVALLVAFGGLAYLVAPRSPLHHTVYVVRGDLDATQQCLLIGDGMDKVTGKSLAYYNTSMLYPDRTQLRSTEPFLGYVALGLPLRLAGLGDVAVFQALRWLIVFASLVYAWLLFRALGVSAALAIAGAVLCVSQPDLVTGIERLQVVAVPLVLAGLYHALLAARAEERHAARAHAAGLFAAAALYPLLGGYNATIVLLAALLALPFLVQTARELVARRRLALLLAPLALAATVDALLLAPWLVDRADLAPYTDQAFLQIKHWQSTSLPLRWAHVPAFVSWRIGASLVSAWLALAVLAGTARWKRARTSQPDQAENGWPSERHLLVLPIAVLPVLVAAALGAHREGITGLGLAFDAITCAALLLHLRAQARIRFTGDRLAGNAALLAAGLAVFLSLMSFGPAYASNGHPLETRLARWLLEVLPALKSIREWDRLWLFGMLATAVYVTLRLDRLTRAARPALRGAVSAIVVCGALWMLHGRTLVASPPIEADADIVALASRSAAKGGVYVHPSTEWNSRAGVMMVANARRLRRPTVNGCLGICPPWYGYAMRVLGRFPDPEALWLLRRWKVQTVVGLTGGLGDPPEGTVKVFEDPAGHFVCDVLPLGERHVHPSEAPPASRGLSRVEGRWRPATGEGAIVEIPVGFAARALELHFQMSVVNVVPERVDVFAPGAQGGARVNEGQSGEWLQSLAADCLLRREAPVATVSLAAPSARALELRFGGGGFAGLERVVLLGEWNGRRTSR